jgi:hypothetical protein
MVMARVFKGGSKDKLAAMVTERASLRRKRVPPLRNSNGTCINIKKRAKFRFFSIGKIDR